MFHRGDKQYIMQQEGEIGLFTSSVIWAVQAEDDYTSHETKVQFRPLAAYDIFHNTNT